jgi:PKD repeat protein
MLMEHFIFLPMKKRLPNCLSFSFVCRVFLALLLLGLSQKVQAQCPVTNACTPGNPPSANLIFGMGIFNVNVNNGAINKTSLGAADGYQNYSCTTGTNLTATVAYPISIQTNPNVNENVRVWLDLDNNGTFNATSELIFSSNNAKLHTGTIVIPATAVTGSPLRMRVSADNFSSPVPTPCSTPQYSQAEDYRITVTSNVLAPIAEFSANNTTTCTGTVNFTDLSQNGPTSWLWNFNDAGSGANNTSTLQNPTHTFSSAGTYTVSLTATNANGSNTVTKTNYITYQTNVPIAAICTPATTSYCCGYGITNVNFGAGQMTNTSADGSAGYQDFTCTKSVSVNAGTSYPISLTSGTNPQDTRIYIDLNNDGAFTGPNEMVLQILNQVNPAGTITIPGTTAPNTPLRMRIVSDEIGSSFTSCFNIQSGQAEDYTIRITPNPNPPVAQFTSDYASSCDTIVIFTDQSTNAPSSWLWNFGDAASGALNTSTLPNPTHIYHNAGTYTVTLTATNSNGNNTRVKTNYITVAKPCLTYCASNGHTNANLYISNVTLANLNNTSGQATTGGYSDFTAMSANIIKGNSTTLSVSRAGYYTVSSVAAWIDFNRNGTFETSERVMAQGYTGAIATAAITVPATAPFGSTRMRVMTTYTTLAATDPCITNNVNTEVEDYTINIQSNQQPPVIDFTVPSQITCSGAVNFTDASTNGPTSWLWNFGDPASGTANTSTLQNPSHTFSATGNYTVTLTATNAYGTNTLSRTNYINYDPNNTFCTTVVLPVTGTAATATRCSGTIYDSGGQTGVYSNNSNSILTIAPTGAASVRLNFSVFSLSTGDVLRIYDGPTTSSPLIGSYAGTTLPNGGIINATRGALTLNFISDASFTSTGFAATWTCTMPTSKPVANFGADFTNICTGVVPFKDLSTNGATSWQWNFGHPGSGAANTSTLQNPSHTYPTTAGAYTVKLIACNSFGCDTLEQINYVNITSPCLTYCASSGHTNTSQWISNVTLGSVNNNTGQETNAYGNYTHLKANLMTGTSGNPFSVTLGNAAGGSRYVAIWIDYNKDGTFQTTEQAFNGPTTITTPGNQIVASGNITVPGTATVGVTRMRVLMSYLTSNTNPCITNLAMGEVEDYGINIQPNTLPVVADFSANLNTVCTGVVQFTNTSANTPTSWLWNFGDPGSGANNASTLQNPAHTYSTTTTGRYTVKLIACKGGVCDTITKTNYVNIPVPCVTYCASNNHSTTQWISNVSLGAINNNSTQEPLGYGNYTYVSTNVTAGSAYPVSVKEGDPAGSWLYASIWIDYNRDGVFQTTERVFNAMGSSTTTGGPIIASGSITVPGTATAGLTRMRVILSGYSSLTNPCITGLLPGETEDYTINIQPNTLPPTANFTATPLSTCNGLVTFTNTTTNFPVSYLWNFGDPGSGTANTSTLLNPTHTFSTAGTYTVTLTATNANGSNTVTKTNYITYDPNALACRTINIPVTGAVTSNTCTGTLYDDGGATGVYSNYANGSVVIAPTGANAVSITFTQFVTESGYDYLSIYDGPTSASPLIGTYSGSSLPNGGLPITSTGGALTITFVTDGSAVYSGFVANWNCVINTTPPVANFTATPTSTCNGQVSFTNTTTNYPTSYLWNFGDPGSGASNTSTLQNPNHNFSAPGNYTVTLTATNANGSHTVTKTNYINYDPNALACRTILMPLASTITTNNCSGILYDDGGASGVYSNYVNGAVVIAPTGAQSVTVTFSQFVTESGYDYVSIYDGSSTSAPLIGTYSGTTIPNGGLPIISTGGALTISFITDGSAVYSGFMATWNCTVNTTPPVPNFTATPTATCNGQVSFTNTTTNFPVSYLWNFGDPASGSANTSTLLNPAHNFSLPGTYSVTLTSTNANGSNTVTKTNYITYDPNAVACRVVNVPVAGTITTNFCSGTLYDDGGAANVYSNYANGTVVIAPTGAQAVSLTFSQFLTESGYDYVYIYDGSSTSAPLIGSYSGSSLPNGGLPIVSTGGALTVSFITDGSAVYSGFAATWSCTVITTPPVANFTATPTSTCNGVVNFTNTTTNYPVSYLWNFGDPGSGSANTSTLLNPAHTFSTPGNYSVTLTATNANGSHTVTKTNYISYDPNALACRFVNMPITGTATSTFCSGTLYDDGGPSANYSYNTNGKVVIAPAGAQSVTLTFTQFNTEFGYDVLSIYDGPTTASPLIGTYSGSTLPNGGLPIVSTTGALTLTFSSNGVGNYSGYVANWNCTVITTPPVPDFTATPTTTCNGVVNFTNGTTNFPTSYSWNFGDPVSGSANTSTLQHPSHTYSIPGIYTVTLTATNANGPNTITKTNYINYDPNALICRTITMPTSTSVTSNFCSGVLYDDGGQTGNYSNNANGTVVIAPTGAAAVALTFTQFVTETGLDRVFIYDGPTAASPLIGTYSGSSLPNGGLPITSTGGALTIRFTSNSSTVYSGFAANWNCVINTTPPVPDFTGAPTTTCNGLVNFTNTTTNYPTSYMWNFGDPGSGTANTSTLQHPAHTFSGPGTYTVTLTAANANGSSTVTKSSYITYDPNALACRTITMPVSGIVTAATCTGMLYDDGGPAGNYANNANSTVVIAPAGAQNVAITFTQFLTESGYDIMYIYDGSSTTSPLIGVYSGSALPNGGLPITSTGNALTIRFGSDGAANYSGFEASWACNTGVGIKENLNVVPFDVYPNPSAGVVNLKLNRNGSDDYQLEVTNVLGEVLLKQAVALTNQKEHSLDLSRLAKGVYFIRIQNGKTSGIRKVVLE